MEKELNLSSGTAISVEKSFSLEDGADPKMFLFIFRLFLWSLLAYFSGEGTWFARKVEFWTGNLLIELVEYWVKDLYLNLLVFSSSFGR